jgi:hypothetical protein
MLLLLNSFLVYIYNKNWKKWQQEFVSENSKTRNVHIIIILGHVCVTTVAVEKQLSITYFECVSVALVIQHIRCMWHYYTVICGLSGSTIFFSHISHRVRYSENLLNVKCVFWFSLQLLSTTLPTIRRTELNTVTKVQMSSHKVPIILVRLEWKSNFLNRF